MQSVPERWQFRFDDDEVSLRDLSWPQAERVFFGATSGDLAGEADGECVSLEFNAIHAAVLYMGRDWVTLRPYFPHRPSAAQDLGPFFCEVGLRRGPQDEYLRCFVGREDGFRLFKAVLIGPSLPSELPDPYPGQPFFPGFEEVAAELACGRRLEWRPLGSSKHKHS
jgi:hypothetical protein